MVVNNRLTPRQNSNLEAELGIKVIDRMQLILDIFALRAHSREGKLQVHLAQLEYLLPRLSGQGIMLSRQAGGIGSRGPGESQLELDRRRIHKQISDIKKELRTVTKNHETVRNKRLSSQVFKIGLIGYTNAGKSTIMNLLTQTYQYEADALFATLDARTKQVYLKDHFQATLTDTVGFIQDLPTELIAAFASTLEESRHVDLLLHVVDASDPYYEDHEKVVFNLLKDLKMADLPRLTVYNKMDKVDKGFIANHFPHVCLSAKSADAAIELRKQLLQVIKKLFIPFKVKVSQKNRYKLYELNKIALLNSYGANKEIDQIEGYVSEKNKWKLEEFYNALY